MNKIILLAGMLSIFIGSRAQVTAAPELKKLVNTAFGYFPRIKEVDNTIATARQQLEITRNNLPRVDANASYNFVEPKIAMPLRK